jgi:hypothetical protein
MTSSTNTANSTTSNRSKRNKDSKATGKQKDSDQGNEQLATVSFKPSNIIYSSFQTDNNDSVDNQSLKNDAVNTSPVVSDKENDSLLESSEDPNMTGELHEQSCHCNKALTYEQLASVDPNLVSLTRGILVVIRWLIRQKLRQAKMSFSSIWRKLW